MCVRMHACMHICTYVHEKAFFGDGTTVIACAADRRLVLVLTYSFHETPKRIHTQARSYEHNIYRFMAHTRTFTYRRAATKYIQHTPPLGACKNIHIQRKHTSLMTHTNTHMHAYRLTALVDSAEASVQKNEEHELVDPLVSFFYGQSQPAA